MLVAVLLAAAALVALLAASPVSARVTFAWRAGAPRLTWQSDWLGGLWRRRGQWPAENVGHGAPGGRSTPLESWRQAMADVGAAAAAWRPLWRWGRWRDLTVDLALTDADAATLALAYGWAWAVAGTVLASLGPGSRPRLATSVRAAGTDGSELLVCGRWQAAAGVVALATLVAATYRWGTGGALWKNSPLTLFSPRP